MCITIFDKKLKCTKIIIIKKREDKMVRVWGYFTGKRYGCDERLIEMDAQ